MKLENLTKENFWNELQEKFPAGMKVFCDWIDEYKIKYDWDKLFRPPYGQRPVASKDPFFNVGMAERQKEWDDNKIKYHDLPFAMQIGIWLEFVADQSELCEAGSGSGIFDLHWHTEIPEIIEMLDEIKKEIN